MKHVIVVTGGSDGLGKIIASQLVSHDSVIILAPSKDKVERVAKEVGCDHAVCDISDHVSVEKAIDQVYKKYGRIDCLINNAGIYIQGKLEENSPEEIKRLIDVNVSGTMIMTRAVVPIMKDQRSGFIINIVSQSGLYGKAERSVYRASKFAITGFTKSLSFELASLGIRVTGIYPGKMNTKLFEKAGVAKAMEDALDPMHVAKIIEFLLTFPQDVVFPEIGIKHIKEE